MSNSYLVDIEQYANFISINVGPYLGASALSSNFYNVIKLSMEYILYPYTDFDRRTIDDELTSYGVDKLASEMIISNLISVMAPFLNKLFDGYVGTHLFDIVPHTNKSVMINIISRLPDEKLPEMDPISRELESLRKSIDNGDYLPERYRRLL